MGFHVRGGGRGFRGSGVSSTGFRVGVFDVRGFGVSGTGFAYEVFDVGFWVQGFGYGISGSWFRDLGFCRFVVSSTEFQVRGF